MKQERRKFFAADFSTEMNQGNQAPRNDGLGSRRQMMARNPSLVENCRAGASPAWATGAVALQFTTSVGFQNRRAESRCCAGRDCGRKQSTQASPSSLRLVLCSLPRERESELIAAHGTRLPRHPKIMEIMNSTRNTTNRTFAMPADAAAIPPNPKTAATSAMIRNITAQPNMSSPPPRLNRIGRLIRAPQFGCSVENSE